jgi:hypothetical protein
MALKRSKPRADDTQLDLFSYARNDTNHADAVRNDVLLEAEEKTANEMYDLTRNAMKDGLTAQQAHDQAWETVRERYILLPPESE